MQGQLCLRTVRVIILALGDERVDWPWQLTTFVKIAHYQRPEREASGSPFSIQKEGVMSLGNSQEDFNCFSVC